MNSKQESETVDDVFSDWDTSGDGELSFKELEEVKRRLVLVGLVVATMKGRILRQ